MSRLNPAISLLALTAACAAPVGDAAPGAAGPAADTGVGEAVDPWSVCSENEGGVRITAVEETAVSTVLRVSWTSAEAGLGWLSWRDPSGAVHATASPGEGTEHSALVRGLPAGTDIDLVALVGTATGTRCSPLTPATIGDLDSALPAITTPIAGAGALDGGFVMIPVLTLDGVWAGILDESGQLVWAWRFELPDAAWSSPIFSVEPDPEGLGIYLNYQADRANTDGGLMRVGWDGEVLSHAVVVGGHTDFALLPEGGFAMLGWELQMHADRRVLGDTVIEVSPDGTQRVLWRSFAHFSFDSSQHFPHGFLPGDPEAEDWSHVNSLRYEPDQDLFLVTANLDDAVVAIDRQTGQSLWSLGTKGGDFAYADGQALTEKPHSAALVGDDVLVFNRGAYDTGASCSRATQISLDAEAGSAGQSWGYQSEICQRVAFLGDAQRLANGNTLVVFSSAGVVEVASPAGEAIWRAQTGVGAGFGFGQAVPTLGLVERW